MRMVLDRHRARTPTVAVPAAGRGVEDLDLAAHPASGNGTLVTAISGSGDVSQRRDLVIAGVGPGIRARPAPGPALALTRVSWSRRFPCPCPDPALGLFPLVLVLSALPSAVAVLSAGLVRPGLPAGRHGYSAPRRRRTTTENLTAWDQMTGPDDGPRGMSWTPTRKDWARRGLGPAEGRGPPRAVVSKLLRPPGATLTGLSRL